LVAASISFLDRLDELMKGYEPDLPSVVDNTDSLRCVSAYSAQNEPRLKDIAARAAAEKKASLAARDKGRREFRSRVRPLNFRIDYDWKTRGAKSPAVYGCWATSRYFQADWVTNRFGESAETCANYAAVAFGGGAVESDWRVKIPEGSFLYTYTQSKDPPNDPPELMRRIVAANVKPPERFACRVADVQPAGDRVVVRCGDSLPKTAWLSPDELGGDSEYDRLRTARTHRSAQLGRHRRWAAPAPSSPSTPEIDPDSSAAIASRYPPVIRLTRGIPVVNIGDVVSVPLGDTKRDPDGLLLLWNPTAPKGSPVWTVDADGASLKVEEPAKCPTVDEILAGMDAGKD
jgi:hypothetical protein